MLRAGFAYDSQAFTEWVETASAPAIPGTLRLVKEAEAAGVSVIFLTGRPDTQRAATEKNLRAQGFDCYSELRMRAPADAHSTAVQFKSEQRRQVAAEGYAIVLSVGDQSSDLRGRPEAEYSVKYPNPYYFIP
jgi:predicted secreted acid phosphatase